MSKRAFLSIAVSMTVSLLSSLGVARGQRSPGQTPQMTEAEAWTRVDKGRRMMTYYTRSTSMIERTEDYRALQPLWEVVTARRGTQFGSDAGRFLVECYFDEGWAEYADRAVAHMSRYYSDDRVQDIRRHLAYRYAGAYCYDAAILRYEDIIARYPKDTPGDVVAEVYHEIGGIYCHQKKGYDKALQQYEIIRQMDVSPFFLYMCDYKRANIPERAGNYEEAIKQYRTVIKKYSGDEYRRRRRICQVHIGDCYAAMGDTQKAIEEYEKVFIDHPGTDESRKAQDKIDKLLKGG